MASKLGKFIESVKGIIQETTDKQTDVLLAKFDQVFPSEPEPAEPAETSKEEREPEPAEPAETSKEEREPEPAEPVDNPILEPVNDPKEEQSSIHEKAQSINDTLTTFIKEEREPAETSKEEREPEPAEPVETPEELAENATLEVINDFKDKLFTKVDEITEGLKEEHSSILEKLQSIYDTLTTFIKEEREPEPANNQQSASSDSNPDSPVVDSSTEVAQTLVAANSSKKSSGGSVAGTLAILSLLRKVAAKIFSPIKAIFGAFQAFIGDRKAKMLLIIMTAISIIAGIISLLKWIYDNTIGKLEEIFNALWDGIMWVYEKLAGLVSDVWDGIKKGIDWVADNAGLDPVFGDGSSEPAYEGQTGTLVDEKTGEKKEVQVDAFTGAASVSNKPASIPANSDAENLSYQETLEKTVQERETIEKDVASSSQDTVPDKDLSLGDKGDYPDSAQSNPIVNNSSYNVDNKVFNLHVQGKDDYYSV